MFDTRNRISRSSNTLLKEPPVWPLPALNGQPPVLLVFDANDPGVDLAYERSPDHEGAMVRSADRNCSRYFLPSLMPVHAVNDGRIVYAAKHAEGSAIIIDHENGWMTLYARLAHMFATPTDRRPPRRAARIKTGEMLGLAGSSLPALRSLRFELWKRDKDDDYVSVDPIRFMRSWDVLPWHDRRFKPNEPAVAA